MPQQPGPSITFPSRISPDVHGAQRRNLAYLTQRGLLTREENVARYLRWDLATLAGRFHPHEVGAELDLGLLQQTFYFFFDDLFDTCLGEEPARAYGLAHHMTRLVRLESATEPPEPAFPLAEVFREMWNDSKRRQPASWIERAATNWEEFFRCYVTEAVNRVSDTVLDLHTYLRYRQRSIGALGVLDLVESLADSQAPPMLHESSCFQQMDRITTEVVTLDNDVCSLEKDESRGEPNALLILQRDQGLSRDESLTAVRKMIRERVERFHQLTTEATRLCDVLDLTPQERYGAHRYIDGSRAMMRGNHDWAAASGRYSTTEAAQRSAGIEDRITELPAEIHPHTTKPTPRTTPVPGSTWGYDPFLRQRATATQEP